MEKKTLSQIEDWNTRFSNCRCIVHGLYPNISRDLIIASLSNGIESIHEY